MKRLVQLVLVLGMCLALVGCGDEYEDTNGEDNFELQTITESNIINRDIGASGLGYEEISVGDITSTEYESKNFNGVEQIYMTNFIGKSDINVYIGHMNVESGNFRLVVINDDKIIDEIPLDAFGDTFLYEDLKGEFAIHVAGESAAFNFHIEVY